MTQASYRLFFEDGAEIAIRGKSQGVTDLSHSVFAAL